jgi:putative nucleotidyltransferase with HDIG domain
MNMERRKNNFKAVFSTNRQLKWLILVGVATVFTLTIYPNVIDTKFAYQLGDVVEKDVKAPEDFFIEDKEATEANRWLAIEEVLTVYDHDTTLSEKIRKNVKEAFDDMQAVLNAAHEENKPAPGKENPSTENRAAKKKKQFDLIWGKKKHFEEKLGIPVSKGAYKILIKETFSYDIAYYITRILSEILQNGVVTNKEILLKEAEKGITVRTVGKNEEKENHQLKKFYGLEQAQAMVRIIGQPLLKDINYNQRNLIVDFVQRLIQPNITLNRNATEQRRKEAANDVKPVMYKIKTGEMILREGERITEIHLLMLKAMQSDQKNRKVFIFCIGAVLLMIALMTTVYFLYLKGQERFSQAHNKDLIFTACVFILFLLLAQISMAITEPLTIAFPYAISTMSIPMGVPIASGAMIVCLFLGMRVAIPFALIMAVAATFIFQERFELFIYFLVNGTLAAFWVQNCRERKVFIKAGLRLSALNVFLAGAIAIYMADFSGAKLMGDLTFALIGGLSAGIVTAGMAPLGEIVFGYTSDIKLLELSNLDQPILRRLLLEAPGTYHHSVIVGSMVEAAATEIGANPLIAKVCGYYHDIGKINKPLYFIENQSGSKNKHDKLAPSMSALILVSHVKDGVEIARQHKLGQIILDTIQQHHGTCLIKYFFEKAAKKTGRESVNIDDFRYPGPKPQTREAAIVMLADVVEAASRTLDIPTPSRIRGMVQRLTNELFSDGQFDHCQLTLMDLHNIAKSFNTILNAIYHHRIDYPEKLSPNGSPRKDKNGSSRRQSSKETSSTPDEDSSDGTGHLKRLGLS